MYSRQYTMDISRIAYTVPGGRIAFLILLRASCEKQQPYNILNVCMLYHCFFLGGGAGGGGGEARAWQSRAANEAIK